MLNGGEMKKQVIKSERAKKERTELLLEDLASLENYVHELFNFSPLPICFVSPLNILLEINPAFEEITGYDFNELIGKSVEELFKSKEITEVSEKVLAGERVEGREAVMETKDGRLMPVQIFLRARKDEEGKTIGYFLGMLDLSEIKEKEKELKKSQTALLNILEDTEEARKRAEREREKTKAVITNLSDGLIVFSPRHEVMFVNPKAEEFLNIKEDEVEGKKLEDIPREGKMSKFLEFIEGRVEKPFSREDLDLREDLILEVSNVDMEQEAEDMGHLVILHDVTREKVVQRLKTEFVSIAAHQLRTPLSAIKWTLKMLLDGDLGELTEEQREFLRKTYGSNERMINLVNSLLNVTRIEEGRFVYKLEPVDFIKLVKSIIDAERPEVEQKGIEIVFEKSEKILEVPLDEEKIRIAVQNLIDNAVKYTLSGKKVWVNIERKGDKIRFAVKDQGVGIPEDQKDRVFSKFFRGSNVMRLETVGTGLGLFITKNIVEAHGGKIQFESEEGEGSIFWFTLPIEHESEKFVEG